MQPGPQDPPQGGYPQQPGAQPGFNVVHNNPYNQPQGPGYVPPPQYAVLAQYNPAPSNPNELMVQTEISVIDQRLSSGCYSCYYILLHIAAVFDVLNMLGSIASVLRDLVNIVPFLGLLISLAFCIIMIDAMKNKKLDKAELGLKIAIVSSVIGLVTMYFWTRRVAEMVGSEAAGTVMIIFAAFAVLNTFLTIFPILKVRERLRSREALLEKLTQPFNV